MIRDFGIIGIMISLLVFFLIGFCIDGVFCSKYQYTAIVVDKHYKVESSSIGTGTAYNSKGMAIVTTYETSPEEYLLTVKDDFGNIATVKCDARLYYEKQLNQEVECYNNLGCLTKIIWSRYALR